MEIKCQLGATDEFLLQILLLAEHVSGTIMPIIRSSRVLYKWLLSVIRSAIKIHLLHLVGILFPLQNTFFNVFKFLLKLLFTNLSNTFTHLSVKHQQAVSTQHICFYVSIKNIQKTAPSLRSFSFRAASMQSMLFSD